MSINLSKFSFQQITKKFITLKYSQSLKYYLKKNLRIHILFISFVDEKFSFQQIIKKFITLKYHSILEVLF